MAVCLAPQAQPRSSIPFFHIGRLFSSFSARERERGGSLLTSPSGAVVSFFYLRVLTQGPRPPRRSIWKVGVSRPWQASAWGWPSGYFRVLTGQLWLPQGFPQPLWKWAHTGSFWLSQLPLGSWAPSWWRGLEFCQSIGDAAHLSNGSWISYVTALSPGAGNWSLWFLPLAVFLVHLIKKKNAIEEVV